MKIDRAVFNSSSRRCTVASKPILVCVSDIESNLRLEDFCTLVTTGTKIVVGTGSMIDDFSRLYTDVHFVGCKQHQRLAHYYANADVVVCPNGMQGAGDTIPESICCGTPVASRSHILTDNLIIPHITGEIGEDLSAAISRCMMLDRSTVEDMGHFLFSRSEHLINQLR